MGKTSKSKNKASSDGASSKRQKKSKKHGKHGKVVEADESFQGDGSTMTPIKLKIKIGGQMMSTQDVSMMSSSIPEPEENIEVVECEEINVEDLGESFVIESLPEYEYSEDIVSSEVQAECGADFGDEMVADDDVIDDEDEESRWLEALESGDLDDNGDIKREKNYAQLTARQRALLHGETENELMQLPSGYHVAQLTEEQLKEREERANQRRLLALEKTEKHKKDTVDRLLKKQEAKAKILKMMKDKKPVLPMYRYINNAVAVTISVPEGFQFPLEAQSISQPKPAQLCGISGCNNIKKYSCSKSGLPLCSIQCYKLNQQRLSECTVET